MATDFVGVFGGNYVFLALFVIWAVFWKGVALWNSARNTRKYWFIALLIINSAGILEIIYMFFFRPDRKKTDLFSRPKKKRKKK